jgi:hypothetical protein
MGTPSQVTLSQQCFPYGSAPVGRGLKDFIIRQDEALPPFLVAVGTNEHKLSPVVGWLGGNQLCVVQLAGQL